MILRAKGPASTWCWISFVREAERWRARSVVFSDQAPLFRHGIRHRIEDPRSPAGSSGLAQFLRLDQRMLDFGDVALQEHVQWILNRGLLCVFVSLCLCVFPCLAQRGVLLLHASPPYRIPR